MTAPDDMTRASGPTNPRRESALDALLAGHSVTEAARVSGYSRPWLSHLLNNDEAFRQELARRQAGLLKGSVVHDSGAGLGLRAPAIYPVVLGLPLDRPQPVTVLAQKRGTTSPVRVVASLRLAEERP